MSSHCTHELMTCQLKCQTLQVGNENQDIVGAAFTASYNTSNERLAHARPNYVLRAN